jgi:Zn-dependent protease
VIVMRQSIRLGRVGGVEIGANWSVLVIVGLLAYGLSATVLPAAAAGYSAAAYVAAGVLVAALFVGCLLAHEVAHALVARYHGVGVRRITLWMLGGVSELEEEARTPGAEAAIAAAGPATSLVLGLVAGLGSSWAGAAGFGDLAVVGLRWLAGVNVVLAVFNLLPGAPLDGGRVLRAILWRLRGDRAAAQVAAGRAGVVVGLLLVAGGLALMLFAGDLSGLWFVLLGWYLTSMAVAERASAGVEAALDRLTVADIMTPDPVCAYAWEPVDRIIASARHRAFPVVDIDGRPVGTVELARLVRIPPALRPVRRILDVATPLVEARLVRPDDRAAAAGRALSPVSPLAVVVAGGRVVGVVTGVDIARAVEQARLS